jgi:hypothetical protein
VPIAAAISGGSRSVATTASPADKAALAEVDAHASACAATLSTSSRNFNEERDDCLRRAEIPLDNKRFLI